MGRSRAAEGDEAFVEELREFLEQTRKVKKKLKKFKAAKGLPASCRVADIVGNQKRRNRPSKRERQDRRTMKGAARFTPCLQCVRSLLRNPRGHCHDTRQKGYQRCYECQRYNRS